jgi:alkanesulfonate monooxygenase SsuD/methylene tetrahydromethanopterin reductase-like flavin-dependent oxidoreductase (luciferase family)
VAAPPEFHLFQPQMRLTLDALVERARVAEASGFVGIWGMDHLVPPLAFDHPMYEAMTTTTWLAARTNRIAVGNLVICDAFRHPAMLAREAVTIDHASGGRFELGIGSGSVSDEMVTFGIGPEDAKARVRRLGETLTVVRALWTGEPLDFDGEFFHIHGGRQLPPPTRPVPIVIGGTGRRTMELVAQHATWWNVPVHQLDRLDTLRDHAGAARVSTQQLVAFVPSETERDEITAIARKRFGGFGSGPVIGTASEIVDFYAALGNKGVERFYVWFTDFAPPATLEAFGADVISVLGETST